MATDRDGTTFLAGDEIALVGTARRVDAPAGRSIVDLGGRAVTVENAAVLRADALRAIEHLLTGAAAGSATAVPLLGPNGAVLDGDGAVPVATARRAHSVAVSMRHGSPGAGSWTATLHRIRAGASSAVATFSFEL